MLIGVEEPPTIRIIGWPLKIGRPFLFAVRLVSEEISAFVPLSTCGATMCLFLCSTVSCLLVWWWPFVEQACTMFALLARVAGRAMFVLCRVLFRGLLVLFALPFS